MLKSGIRVLFTAALFLPLFSSISLSQDLIVTNKADSFNVKINKVDQRYIYFTYRSDGKNLKTLIPLEEVSNYHRDFYTLSEVKPVEVQPTGAPSSPAKNFNIELFLGWSYQLASIDIDQNIVSKSYLKELKSGYNLGVGMDYFITESYGIGFRFSQFKTQNETTYTGVDDQGNQISGEISDDITVGFIGPTFCARYVTYGNTMHLFFNASLGYSWYHNDAVLILPLEITGNTFGIFLETGLDFMITESFSLGGKVCLHGGALSKVTLRSGGFVQIVNFQEEERIGLGRVDLALSLKAHF